MNKKNIFLISLLIVSVVIFCSCNNTNISNNDDKAVNNTLEESNNNELKINNDLEESNDIAELSDDDFIIRHDDGHIELGSKYEPNVINIEEQEFNFYGENNVVCTESTKDAYYRWYIHMYIDAYIYTSNAFYDTKNISFEKYFITEINVSSNNFKTNRNITIGNTYDEIIKKYGENYTIKDNSNDIIYTLDDKTLMFYLDENNVLTNINMQIKKVQDRMNTNIENSL